jgi:hypothetical protein
MTLAQYIQSVNSKYISGIAREHAYRADLENLIKNIVPHIDVTNEPANVTDCGNPDYVLTENKIVVIVLNDTDTAKSFNILVPEEPVTASLSAGSVGTYIWNNK